MTKPKMPARKSFGIHLSIGLVTLVCDGFSATEDSATKKSTFIEKADANGVATLHPVGVTPYNKITGENVVSADTIKCIESTDGTLVPVTEDEIGQFISQGDNTATLVGFLPVADYHATYVEENCYQIRPTTKIGDKTIKGVSPYAKPFALFLEAMRDQGVVGLVKFNMRSTDRYYGWLPDGTLRSLRYDEEVREARPIPAVTLSDAEKTMGGKLVQALVLTEPPVLTDETNTKIKEFVEVKAAAMAAGEEVILPAKVEQEVEAPSDDLMALLAASL